MFYNLIYLNLIDSFASLNILKYITVRSGAALTTSFLLMLIFGPKIIEHFKIWQAKLKTVRDDLPESHTKKLELLLWAGL